MSQDFRYRLHSLSSHRELLVGLGPLPDSLNTLSPQMTVLEVTYTTCFLESNEMLVLALCVFRDFCAVLILIPQKRNQLKLEMRCLRT